MMEKKHKINVLFTVAMFTIFALIQVSYVKDDELEINNAQNMFLPPISSLYDRCKLITVKELDQVGYDIKIPKVLGEPDAIFVYKNRDSAVVIYALDKVDDDKLEKILHSMQTEFIIEDIGGIVINIHKNDLEYDELKNSLAESAKINNFETMDINGYTGVLAGPSANLIKWYTETTEYSISSNPEIDTEFLLEVALSMT